MDARWEQYYTTLLEYLKMIYGYELDDENDNGKGI